MSPGTTVGEMDWMLVNLAASADGVRAAVILSADGLPLGRSPGLSHPEADHLAALASAAQGLGHGAGAKFGTGTVTQIIIEMDAALLFITPAGGGTSLALLAHAGADVGQIAYEMAVLVKRVGQHMTADARGAGRRAPAR